MNENYFAELYLVDVSDKIEKKNGLSYVSWPFAWAEVKKRHPDATYTIYERQTEFGPVNYFTDGRTCWVKTGVTINGIEHIEELPVMDFRNRSVAYEAITSMDTNKSIQRSLTKACARHGLGLYVYAGEDLPEGAEEALVKSREGKKARPEQVQLIVDALGEERLEKMLKYYNITKPEDLSANDAGKILNKIREGNVA